MAIADCICDPDRACEGHPEDPHPTCDACLALPYWAQCIATVDRLRHHRGRTQAMTTEPQPISATIPERLKARLAEQVLPPGPTSAEETDRG